MKNTVIQALVLLVALTILAYTVGPGWTLTLMIVADVIAAMVTVGLIIENHPAIVAFNAKEDERWRRALGDQ